MASPRIRISLLLLSLTLLSATPLSAASIPEVTGDSIITISSLETPLAPDSLINDPGNINGPESETELFDAIYPDTPENEEAVGTLPPEKKTPVNYTFRPNQLITPAILITAGSIGVGCFQGFKESIRHHLADLRGDRYLHFDDYIQYTTPVAYYALGFTRLPSRGDHIDRLLTGVTAYAMMGIVVNAVKYTVREMRPDNTKRNSFPSGHSGIVFTGAELLRLEYGNYIGIAGYAVACTVGFMRMYNERHWLNDVLAGAGIGILAARAAYWMLPWERKIFRLDKPRKNAEASAEGVRPAHDRRVVPAMAASPWYDPSDRRLGLSFSAVF